jgi:hypothetical protein
MIARAIIFRYICTLEKINNASGEIFGFKSNVKIYHKVYNYKNSLEIFEKAKFLFFWKFVFGKYLYAIEPSDKKLKNCCLVQIAHATIETDGGPEF